MADLDSTSSAITGIVGAGLVAGVGVKTLDFVSDQTRQTRKKLPKAKKKLPKAKSRLPRAKKSLPTFDDMYPSLSRKKKKSKKKGRMTVDDIFDFNF